MFSYVGEDKLITKINRTDVQFHAMRAIQELSYDVLRSFKSQEIEIPPTLTMPLPQDYVNYIKIVRIGDDGIERNIYPTPTIDTIYTIHYYKTPSTPAWGYVVVNGKALYNNSVDHSTNFELHPSEEEVLVARILQLAGIVIMKPGIVEIGSQDRANIKGEQNN